MTCLLVKKILSSTNILKCVQMVKVNIFLWFAVCCVVVFFMLMASANPPSLSRQCQYKNEPRGPLCLLQKLDYSNKKITLQTTPTSTKTKLSQCLTTCGD